MIAKTAQVVCVPVLRVPVIPPFRSRRDAVNLARSYPQDWRGLKSFQLQVGTLGIGGTQSFQLLVPLGLAGLSYFQLLVPWGLGGPKWLLLASQWVPRTGTDRFRFF